MVLEKKAVRNRVASVTGVPMAEPKQKTIPSTSPHILPPQEIPPVIPTPLVPVIPRCETLWWFDDKTLECQEKEFCGAYMYRGLRTFKSKGLCERALKTQTPRIPIPPIPTPPIPEMPLPEVKNIRTTELRSDFARLEWDVARMPSLAYKIWLDGVARGTAVTEPRIDLAGLKPGRRYKVEIRTQPHSKSDLRAPSEKVTYYFTTSPAVTPPVPPVVTPKGPEPPKPPVKIPLKEQVWYFDDDMLRCKVLSPSETVSESAHKFTNRRECNIALIKHIRDTRKITPKRPLRIAKLEKRKVSARAEELMKKRSFPKAVKEAIEKGLEREDAPRDIERMIEKVAKTNEPNYMLKRTLAKRIRKGGAVQYRVETDKGTIVYENADEQTKNAILGMPTPTGEVIPLQIKVVR